MSSRVILWATIAKLKALSSVNSWFLRLRCSRFKAAASWSMNKESAYFSKLFISIFISQHTTVLPLDMKYPLEGSYVEGLVHNWLAQALRWLSCENSDFIGGLTRSRIPDLMTLLGVMETFRGGTYLEDTHPQHISLGSVSSETGPLHLSFLCFWLSGGGSLCSYKPFYHDALLQHSPQMAEPANNGLSDTGSQNVPLLSCFRYLT